MELTKRELLLEKRLNELSTASLPKPKVEKVVSIRSATVGAPALMLTPDQLDLRDLAYEARANTISTNAIVQRLGWKPSKIQSAVTKEMIADYQFEQAKRVQRGVYIPANLDIDLEPEVDNVFFDITNQELEELTRVKLDLIAKNKRIDELLSRLPAIEQQITDEEEALLLEYTRFILPIEEIDLAQTMAGRMPTRRELDAFTELLDGEELRTLLGYLEAYDTFDAKREQLKREVLQIREEYNDNTFAIDRIDAKIAQNREDLREVGAVKSTIDQRNAQRRRLYVDQIKLLNDGRMDVEMLPNETQEEYTARLQEVGATTPDPDSVQAAAKLFYTDVLREKLQEIISNDADIGTFIKDMDGDERYIVVKNFPKFKKRFQDIMGKEKVGGQGVINTMLEVKDAIIGTLSQETADETVRVIEDAAGLLGAIPVDQQSMADVIRDINRSRQLTQGQRRSLLDFTENRDTPEYVLRGGVQPSEDKKQEYSMFRARITQLYGEVVAPRPDEFAKLMGAIRRRMAEIELDDPKRESEDLQREYEPLDQMSRATNIEELEKLSDDVGLNPSQYTGSGLKRGLQRKHDKVVQFGRVDIHPQRLFYDNVLKITKNGRSITGIPNVKVSDAFGDVVLSVLKGKTPTMKDFNRMSAQDKKHYDMLVFSSGLHKDVESTGSGIKQDLKARLELIEGEIQACNNNAILIKEARQVLHQMAQMKMVSRPKAVAHLKQLQSFR